jgi:hypothetical protein
MTLIVNPLAAIDVFEDSGDLISGGPVPGRGMQFLQISAAENPRLHELFSELSAIGIASLDIASDLSEDEIPLLRDYGILVEEDNVPERPLFLCMLDDVEAASELPASLIVNPTLEFQPFDLTKFRSWIQEKHLSPHHATVWVTDPRTEIRWGYWLKPAQAELIKTFEPGLSVTAEINPHLVSKLYQANILVDPSAKPSPEFELAAENFGRDRYTVVTDIVPRAQLRALQRYYRSYVEQGFMKFGDNQVSRRFAEHGEAVASMMHAAFEPLMRRITRVPVTRTYAYSAVYAEGADLKPHVDRDACEYSFSFQLEYLPEQESGVSPWALYVSSNQPDDLHVDPEKDRAVHLPNGGFLAYKGRELVHYRTPLFPGHRSSSIFFHYVPA